MKIYKFYLDEGQRKELHKRIGAMTAETGKPATIASVLRGLIDAYLAGGTEAIADMQAISQQAKPLVTESLPPTDVPYSKPVSPTALRDFDGVVYNNIPATAELRKAIPAACRVTKKGTIETISILIMVGVKYLKEEWGDAT